MSAAEPPAPPGPTIDPSLLELEVDGRAYKDPSRSAAAQRAAYHRAKANQFLASSGSLSPAERTRMAADARWYWADFENFGTSPDWTPEFGNQGPSPEGWTMHSQGTASSRMKFNYPINDGSSPATGVSARMRGASNNGKNSYVTLIEQFCADNPGNHCDEIDLVEYYGQTSAPRSEFTIHKTGQVDNVGFMKWPAPTDPGSAHYSYQVYLEPGNYLWWTLIDPNGVRVGQWDRHSTDGYVPARTMNLYAGIWDIGSIGINVDVPPGSFTGDSWMALSNILVTR